MELLRDSVTKDEYDFVWEVIKSQGAKIEVIGSPWLRPEALGFIERIGAGKWIITDKLNIKIFVKD